MFNWLTMCANVVLKLTMLFWSFFMEFFTCFFILFFIIQVDYVTSKCVQAKDFILKRKHNVTFVANQI